MKEQNERFFRSSAFGGFNRQDVLKYIEMFTSQKKGESEELKKELAEKDLIIENQSHKISEYEEKLCNLEKKLLDEESRIKETNSEISSVMDERTLLSERIRELSAIQNEYEKMKSHFAEIEISAYRRAKLIEDEAYDNLLKMRLEADSLLKIIREGFLPMLKTVNEHINIVEQSFSDYKRNLYDLSVKMSSSEKLYAEFSKNIESAEDAKKREGVLSEGLKNIIEKLKQAENKDQ